MLLGITYFGAFQNNVRQDRTEAQQRAALHSHILLWFRRRIPKADWTPLKPIPRTVKGKDLKQRDKEHEVPPQVQKQEDNIYHLFEAARISGEMPRPFVGGDNWGGYDIERLRIAGLARHCLERLNYMHVCTPHYCLKNRSCCRFLFPWPYMPYLVWEITN